MSRFAIILCLALAGCAGARDRHLAAGASVTLEAEPEWRTTIAQEDAARIATLPAVWQAARTRVGRRGAAALRAAGDLLRADAALDHPALPPGSYKCRSLILAGAAVRRSPSFFCYVGGEPGEKVSFTKQTGSSLPGGWLYPDEGRRYVFVGARQHRPGETSLGYGEDRARDLVGVVERVGPFRWRLVLPGRDLEVYELTPVPNEQQGATG